MTGGSAGDRTTGAETGGDQLAVEHVTEWSARKSWRGTPAAKTGDWHEQLAGGGTTGR